MCDVATVTAVTTMVATAFSVQQARAQGRFSKGTARYNARVAENQAQAERNKGVEAENIQRDRAARLLSKQRAQLGASNIDLSSGSALQLQEDTQTLSEIDSLRIRSNTDDRVNALNTGADLTRQQGEFASAAGTNKAFTTLLGGTANVLDTGVADKWFKPNSAAVVLNN